MPFKKKTSFWDEVKTITLPGKNKNYDIVIKIGQVSKVDRVPGLKLQHGPVIGYTWSIYRKMVSSNGYLDDYASYGEYEKTVKDAEEYAVGVAKDKHLIE